MHRLLLTALAAAAVAGPVHAAPSTRVRVDRQGVLHLSAAQLKALGVTPSKEGYLGVQFPRAAQPAAARGKGEHAHAVPDLPATVWAPVRRDRSVSIGKTRIGPKEYLPGPPGTLYLATAAKGKVVLRSAAKQAGTPARPRARRPAPRSGAGG
jgi:hypothetical protein